MIRIKKVASTVLDGIAKVINAWSTSDDETTNTLSTKIIKDKIGRGTLDIGSDCIDGINKVNSNLSGEAEKSLTMLENYTETAWKDFVSKCSEIIFVCNFVYRNLNIALTLTVPQNEFTSTGKYFLTSTKYANDVSYFMQVIASKNAITLNNSGIWIDDTEHSGNINIYGRK